MKLAKYSVPQKSKHSTSASTDSQQGRESPWLTVKRAAVRHPRSSYFLPHGTEPHWGRMPPSSGPSGV